MNTKIVVSNILLVSAVLENNRISTIWYAAHPTKGPMSSKNQLDNIILKAKTGNLGLELNIYNK